MSKFKKKPQCLKIFQIPADELTYYCTRPLGHKGPCAYSYTEGDRISTAREAASLVYRAEVRCPR